MKKKLILNILHLEDDPVDAELIAAVLTEENIKSNIKIVETHDDFVDSIKNEKYDIILADYSLPDFDGMTALKLANEIIPNTPFIFVSGTLGEERAIESLKSGATDYVVKQRLSRLVPTIYRALEEIEVKIKRKKAEQKLKASLKEKEILLKEIHHRVKNNLQIISSLLNLQLKKIGDKTLKDQLRNSQDRVRSMAIIHETLYKSDDFARVNFIDYIQSLTKHLFHSYGVDRNEIDLQIKVQNISLDLNRAISCGLIINELVSNSLKHAFKRTKKESVGKDKICIELTQDKTGHYILIVSDNGVGIDSGVDLKNLDSLGLHLVESLSEQLGGSITINRKAGTEFIIRFNTDK